MALSKSSQGKRFSPDKMERGKNWIIPDEQEELKIPATAPASNGLDKTVLTPMYYFPSNNN